MEVGQISTLGGIRNIPWCLLTIEATWPTHRPQILEINEKPLPTTPMEAISVETSRRSEGRMSIVLMLSRVLSL